MSPFEGSFGSFLLTLGGGAILIVLTFWFARKSGVLPVQETLIDTLKDNAMALGEKVKLLEEHLKETQDVAERLEARVTRLSAIIVTLVDENDALRRKIGLPPRTKRLDPEEDFGGS
jgi:hypothetical protein